MPMYSLFIKPSFNALVLLGLTLLPITSHALSKDVEEPVNIDANAAEFDRNAGTASYSGNVIIKQGTLEILASRVDILAPNNEIQKITASGNPITFKQLMDDGKQASGQAKTMIYLVTQKLLTLNGDARLVQDRDNFASNRIEYETNTGRLKAGNATVASKQQPPQPNQPQGRVKAIFYPSNKASGPAQPPAAPAQ